MVPRRSGRRAPVMVALSAFWILAGGGLPRIVWAQAALPPPRFGSEQRSAVRREVVPVTEAGPASAAVADLGASLYRRIAASKTDKNLVFSPLSVEAALAMVRNGATGETRQEMDRVLGAGPDETLDRALNALDAALAARSRTVVSGFATQQVALRMSNALWAQQGFVVYAGFLDTLARHYGAGVNTVDFAGAAEQARTRINAFVSQQTNGRISEILPKGSVSAVTRLVLTNTVWFKAPWAKTFTRKGDLPFHRADGTTVSVPTMMNLIGPSGTVPGAYGEGPGWKAAEVPYLGNQLSMVVIVPDDLASFESGLDGATLSSVTGGLRGALRTVQMPLWTTRTSVSLPADLKALGMSRAFAADAEFDGLSPEPTRISDVLHQAFVAVDEKGTEAAAATAVVYAGCSAVPTPKGTPIVVDRPFLYAIRDVETGAVLFLGRVLDPSQASEGP
jgi:serpin B